MENLWSFYGEYHSAVNGMTKHASDTTLEQLPRPMLLKMAEKNGFRARLLRTVVNCLTFFTYFPDQPMSLRSFRISSEMFPCYTLDFTRDWYKEIWEDIETMLAQAGKAAKRRTVRLSVHPGQYTVLASNKPDVVEKSIEDLEYHAPLWIIDGTSCSRFFYEYSLTRTPTGGKHEDGIKRFATHFPYLSDYAQGCLSVENEDKPNGYDIRHTLELAQRIPIRCTLDTHHYACHRMVETEDKMGEKTVNRKVRDVDHITHTHEVLP